MEQLPRRNMHENTSHYINS